MHVCIFFFFSSRRRHTRYWRDWSSDVCSSDLLLVVAGVVALGTVVFRFLPQLTLSNESGIEARRNAARAAGPPAGGGGGRTGERGGGEERGARGGAHSFKKKKKSNTIVNVYIV